MKNILLIAVLFIAYNLMFAGTTGKLTGKITDEYDNEVAYANVQIKKIQLGVQADKNGNYVLWNIPSGFHEITCSQISHQTHQIKNVQIISDETTILNITLSKTVQEIEGIKISEAKTKAVDHLKTSSGNVISSRLIQDLQIQNIDDIIALQAGTYVVDGKLHIRGGKVNEVMYLIDGVAVNDIVDGQAELTIDVDAIKEMKVMTGGFPAEYGNAQSGIINIITKDGGEELICKVEAISDHVLSSQNQNSDQIKFSASGPVFPFCKRTLNFSLNISNLNHDSEFRNDFGANAFDELLFLDPVWSEYNYYDPTAKRDEFAGFETEKRLYNFSNGSFKLTCKISPLQKFAVSLRAENNCWQPYNHYWRYALQHYKKIKVNKANNVFSYENVLNPNMILNFSISKFTNNFKEGPLNISKDSFFGKDEEAFNLHAENPLGNSTGIIYNNEYGYAEDPFYLANWYYFIPQLNEYKDIEEFAAPGTIAPRFVDDQSSNVTIDLDFEWQYNRAHDFKTGLEFVQHNIKKYRYSAPWELDEYRYDTCLNNYAEPQDSIYNSYTGSYFYYYGLNDIYTATLAASGETFGFKARPWQLSWYIQDKMEWEGLVVNAGIRLDMWNLGSHYEVLNEFNQYEKTKLKSDEQLHHMISPRIGVSHTISTNDVLHFAFNRQSQLPQLQYVYPTASWFEQNSGIDDHQIILIANPNLDPQTTIAGEIGLQHQFNDDFIGDVTVFYKKNYNYISIEKTMVPEQYVLEYYQYISDNYGTAKGLDFNLQKILSNFIVGSLAYSLSWAEGTDARIYDYLRQDQKILEEFPMDWDARHNLSLNIGFEVHHNEELFLPFSNIKIPIDDFSVNFLYNFASGTPYTDKSDENYEINNKRKPYTDVAQLTFTKNFRFYNYNIFKVYFVIENLFDKRNIDFAYLKTGSPYYDGVDISDPGTGYVYEETKHIHDLYAKNPGNVSFGRRMLLGISCIF
ncbi:carboxypeptidase-like regulatory domain-containing protein [Candidatus Cloacimonadota bacterium]